ncbi:MAG: phosphocholine cytidylyltransferase family protein [Pseudomonadota bacterium]
MLLSAGQGRRLAPLTNERPKCLVEIASKPLLEWQLAALSAAGIEDVTIVTGFGGQLVETAVKVMGSPLNLTCLYNPFFSVADNIGSCWIARDFIGDDTVLINGDTLFDPRILSRVLSEAHQPISVTVDCKDIYDDDDMKVSVHDGCLRRISKTLSHDVNGESIGMIRFRDGGGERFVHRLRNKLQDPDALRLWYLSVIDELSQEGGVGVVSIAGLPWAEVDFLHDLPVAAERIGIFEWPALGSKSGYQGRAS